MNVVVSINLIKYTSFEVAEGLSSSLFDLISF